MIELRLLGEIGLGIANGPALRSLEAQPKRLALLSYLALTPMAQRRDKLLALFWPETDTLHARTSLRKALHFLRRTLGADTLGPTGGEEVALNRQALWCDAVAFQEAIRADRPDQALELYRGDLLEGFFLREAPGFERWLETERMRLRSAAARAARLLLLRYEEEHNLHQAIEVAQRAMTLEPDEEPLRHLIRLLDRLGDRAAAIRAYETFARQLREEYGTSPTIEMQNLIREIRNGAARGVRESHPPREPAAARDALSVPQISAGPSAPPEDRGRVAPAARRTLSRWVRGSAVIATFAAVVWGGRLASSSGLRPPTGTTGPYRPVVAVLPFDNLATAAEEYIASGFTEEITARLAGLTGLRVISRTTASQYGRAEKPIKQIGQELGTDYLVEGSVRSEIEANGARHLRITPQLIRVRDDIHLWAGVYDVTLPQVLAVQADIARQVADSLAVVLPRNERLRLASPPTHNPEAYDLYSQGNHALRRGYREEDLRRAADLYQRAIELDPDFALAWATLALAHGELYWSNYDRTPTRLDRMKATADRALALAPDLSKGHLARGYYFYYGNLDYEHALAEFTVAAKAEPNNSDIAEAIGYVQRRQGRWEEAAASLEQAATLNPRSFTTWYFLGSTYFSLRRYEEAERRLRRARSLGSDQTDGYIAEAELHLNWNANVEKARTVLEEARRYADPTSLIRTAMFANGGELLRVFPDYFESLLDQTAPPAFGDMTELYSLARANVLLGKGRRDLSRTHFESARQILVPKARRSVSHYMPHLLLALTHAGTGRSADALREGRIAAELLPIARDVPNGTDLTLWLAQIYALAGARLESEACVKTVLATPHWFSGRSMSIDPVWSRSPDADAVANVETRSAPPRVARGPRTLCALPR